MYVIGGHHLTPFITHLSLKLRKQNRVLPTEDESINSNYAQLCTKWCALQMDTGLVRSATASTGQRSQAAVGN